MPNSALLALVLAAGALTPGAALGQGPMDVAMAGPQPHFVAAWAPEKEREAEHSAALARRVSLELQDVSLDAALKALTNRAGLRITYSQAILPKGKRVTIKAGDIAVVTALTEMLFRSGLDVVVDQDGTLALVRCKHVAPRAEVQDSGTIVGAVTDKATGAPLVGATVVVEGTKWSATTGGEGGYRIEGVEPRTHTVRARYIGYASLTVRVVVPEGGEITANFGLVRSTQRLDELVTVTPGGLQTELKAVPSPVSVITAQDIEARRPQTISDLFRQLVPSAVGFESPVQPVVTRLTVRGASSLAAASPVKIFLDGVETSERTTTPVDPASIERMEVIRGPQAATLYGADAAGGVLQIFTKRGDPSLTRPQVQLQAQAGLLQTPYDGFGEVLRQQYSGGIRGGGQDVSYNFGGGYTHLADWLPTGAPTGQSSPSIYGGIGYAGGIVTADLHARYLRNILRLESNPLDLQTGFVPSSRPQFTTQSFLNETYGARFAVRPTSWWHNQLTLGVDRNTLESEQTERRLTTPSDTLFSIGQILNRKLSVFYNSTINGSLSRDLAASLTVGIDHSRADVSSFSTASALNTEGTILTEPPGAFNESKETVNATGYFAQTEVNWRETAFLTGGVRADENSTFGEALGTPVQPRIGFSVVRQIGQTNLKVRAAYGRAIRAPAAGQGAGSVTPTAITLANTQLAPERQRGWDAGIDFFFGDRASVSLSGYKQIAEDLIAFLLTSTDPVLTFQFQNVGRVANSGVELEGSLYFGSVALKAQYAYVHSKVEELGPAPGGFVAVGDRPLSVPKHTAGATLSATPLAGTSLTAGLTYVGSFRALDILTADRCFGGTGPCPSPFALRGFVTDYPGFVKLNAAITQRITRQMDGFVTVDNLTDSHAYESSNASPVMGRVTMAGLRATF